MELHCWGISHKSTSLEVREKFAFNKKEIDENISKTSGCLFTEICFLLGLVFIKEIKII